jgi:PST family polysaccharide transporter
MVFSFTSISSVIKMLTSFISVKIVSLIVGPVGIAFIGQLNNFSSIVNNLSCGGIHSGVTKYIAENKENSLLVNSYISTAFKITLFCSSAIGMILICFHAKLSQLIMLSSSYEYIFIVFGVTIFFYALNNLFISILSGYNEYKKNISVNIATSVVSLIFTIILVFFFKLKGALISIVTFQSVVLFVTLLLIRKSMWATKASFFSKLDLSIVKKYSRYAFMTFTAITILPISQIFLRRYVMVNISAVEAGWWDAMNKISSFILSFLVPFLNVYFLPRISQAKTKIDIRNEIFRVYKIIIPLFSIGIIIIYIFRLFIIKLLFTADFFPMESLFKWQLAGDMIAIPSYFLGYLLIAKSD